MAALGEAGVSPTSSTFEIIEMGEDGILTEQTASEDTGDGGPVAADRPPFSVDDKDCTEHEGAVKTGRGGGGAGFEIGQRVTDEKYGRGVLKWIGDVGGEKMAGIELEESRDGCGNGCLPGSEKKLFPCEDGRSVFTPLSRLMQDETDHVDQGRLPSQQADRPTLLFDKGSMVEVKGYGYGVVQWVGTLEGRETAGVELEEYKVNCGAGTPEGGNAVLFPCQPGHAIFTPVQELVPDPRFLPEEAANPLDHVSLEPVNGRSMEEVPHMNHYCRGREWGVQGEHNSCYIDATLFGLFALSSEFDNLLASLSPREGPQGEIATNISSTLQAKIINPLRKNGVIRSEPIQSLRSQLDKLGEMAGLTQDEKDPEEFLNLLFKQVLCIQPFISIRRPQGMEEEFFVQLFMEPDPSLKLPTIGTLLARMFQEQDIKFSKIPSKLLIQVPRYGKQFKTFQRVIPDKRLDIKSLCTSDCLASSIGEIDAHLQLLSVVCIETSHYVCFTRADGRWVFMDSMADRVDNHYNIPLCNDCTEELEEWVYSNRHLKELKQAAATRKLPELVRRFTQDVYMCVYVEDSTAV